MPTNITKRKKPALASTPLWGHQRKAISTVRKYVAVFNKDKTIGSALIHMPTGTGKTGVIACASHFLQNAGFVLVLCPRIALRDQLYKEVDGRFFYKLGLDD
ncbi:MAG: DEAD/DEAH box helicase family protein, partial [Deltaproteobacteria bacterium]|nr:DEAD/DEAH box helicase family protein [Deltaproteobacteria bacterium]